MQARLQLQVEVQVGLGERRLDTCLVQERAQALVLLGRKNDRRPISSRRETGQRPRLADERLSLEPPEIDRVAGSLRARKEQVGPGAEVVSAIDRRKLELTRQLTSAGLRNVSVSPRMVYVDGSRPDWIEGFTLNTFTAMVEGVRDQATSAGLMDADSFDRGIAALRRTAAPDGVFCYTFFKATAERSIGD